jgi:hypothetical protein
MIAIITLAAARVLTLRKVCKRTYNTAIRTCIAPELADLDDFIGKRLSEFSQRNSTG